MGQKEKLIERLKAKPKTFTFDDAESLLRYFDYTRSNKGKTSVLSDARKIVFVYAGASALAGYESVNWGTKVLHDGSTLHDRDAFIYGGALTLDVECYVADRIALLANLRERCLWGGDTRKFHTQFGVGIKFIIN